MGQRRSQRPIERLRGGPLAYFLYPVLALFSFPTDVMAPGWIAEVDGIPTPIARVDAAFRGVPIDGNTRTIVFSYRPVFTYLGFALAVLAAALTVAFGLVSRRRDGRAARRGAELA